MGKVFKATLYSDVLLHANLVGSCTGMLHLLRLHGLYPFNAIIINKFTYIFDHLEKKKIFQNC